MKRAGSILMLLAAALLAACDGKKQGEVPEVEILPLDSIPGIYEARGRIGEGTSMNMLEFISDDGDTIYVTMNDQMVRGGMRVGDEIEIIYNVAKDDNRGAVAVNLTALQHVWVQKGADGKEQSLEIDPNGSAATYDMAVSYDAWEVKDGLLLLHSPKKIGDESPALVDTFEIMQLTADSLVLMNGNLVTEFERYN